jgi:SAM-dependent methyltransferase
MDRSPYEGMRRVVQFNWPLYAIAAVAWLVSFALFIALPLPWRIVFFVISVGIASLSVLSLFASHAVYDVSALHHWKWLREIAPPKIQQILNIHSGYDETSGALAKVFPEAKIAVVDLYPSLQRKEPSIERARKAYPPASQAISTSMNDWPIEGASQDLILLAFAAHEVRSHEGRVRLLQEAGKKLKPSGAIVLVEHLRDVMNALFYGPGCLHFFSQREWLNCVKDAGLKANKVTKFTPFVAVIVIGV